MIIDSLKNADTYIPLHQRFAKAFEYIKNTDFASLEPGRYEIDGDDIFIMLSLTDLKNPEDAPLEVHDKYIDIQYVIEGEETFGWTERSECRDPKAPMDVEKDVQFFNDEHATRYTLRSGDFCIFFPNDGHAPMIGDPKTKIKKCIVKILK